MANGSIIIETEIDNSGIEKGMDKATSSAKAQASKLAKEYEKQGMSASEAFKKAWNEIEESAKKKSNQTKEDWEKATERIKSAASTGLKVLSGAAIGIGGALAVVGKESIETASDLTEVQNVVDTTFGSGASQINDWANKADTAFGLSTLQAKQFTGTLGAMLKSSGIAGNAIVGMSENMVGLSGDFASFYNLKPEEAFEKIRAGISGETEPLKQLGINMSVANLNAFALSQGIKKTYDSMSQGEQVQLRYNYLMSVSKDAQGDFAKTSDSFANQMRIASLNVKSLFADIGTLLIPVAQNAAKAFNDVVGKLREAFQSEEMKAKIQSIAENVGKLIEKIAELIANWLPKIINGFEWILENGSGIATTIVTIATAIKTLEVIAIIVSLVEKFKAIGGAMKLFQAGLSLVGGPVGLVIGLIAGLVAGIVVLWNTNEGFRNAVIGAWNKIKEEASKVWNSITKFFTETIPQAWDKTKILFTETIPKATKKMWDDIKIGFNNGWNAVKTFFTETIPNFIKNIPNYLAAGLGMILGAFLKLYMQLVIDTGNAIDSVIKWFQTLPSRIGAWLTQTASNIAEWAIQVYTNMSNSIDNTITTVGEWFKSLPSRIQEGLTQAIESAKEWGSQTYEAMKEKASEIIDSVGDWFNNLPNRMQDIGRNIVAGLKQGVEDAWSGFKSWIGSLCDSFTGGFMKGWEIHSPSRVFRDLIGKNIVAGIQVGVDYEFPNLQKSVQGNISDFSRQMKATVGYETAKTTAMVSAQNNFTIKQANENFDNKTSNQRPILLENTFDVDGRRFVQEVVAPHQKELDRYYEGRTV